MKNADSWKPIRWNFDKTKNRLVPNLSKIYPGSVHIAYLQAEAYLPIIMNHIAGRMLDCGCDQVPYYEVYRDQILENICLDWKGTRSEIPWVDVWADMNEDLPFESGFFDSILCTDILPHVWKPEELFKEFCRILKPGGKVVLTSIFNNWLVEPPHEFGHYSEYALRRFCEENGFSVVQIESYGGHADVLLDTLNKGMTGRVSNRIFRMIRALVISTPWYKVNRAKTRHLYPLGYSLVAIRNKD